MTQRVVVTGLGIVSSLGNNASEVTDSLRNGKSGITYNATQEEIGMRSWVSGKPDIDLSEHIDRKQWRKSRLTFIAKAGDYFLGQNAKLFGVVDPLKNSLDTTCIDLSSRGPAI